MKKDDNKFFCVLPFIHFATSVNGKVRLCCKVPVSDSIRIDNKEASLETHSIRDFWYSDYMNGVREQMILGQAVKDCKQCYYEDSINLKSKRINENEYYYDRYGADLQNKISLTPDMPIYLDLRLGNLCNLKCRMCGTQYSSQHVKEYTDLIKDYPTLGKDFKETYFGTQQDDNWFENPEFWKDIDKLAHNVDHLIFAGGEPTLHPGVFRLLEKCVELGKAKDIRVRLTTNMTNIPQKFVDIVDEFKQFTFECSIDGTENIFNYIRHPGNWNAIKENFEKILPTNAWIMVTSTIQFYNFHDVVRLWSWVNSYERKRLKFYPTLLYTPSYFQPGLIKEKEKETLINHIENYMNHLPETDVNTQIKERMKGILEHVALPIKDREKHIRSLIKITKVMDNYRNEDVYNIIPGWDCWIS
jgi:sulfatase maturation enzyme AslB (radical SAM superfamily)